MTVAVHQDVCSSFFQRVRRASSRALLLDYDGTLAPFTPDRTRAFPYREIPELVSQIMRQGTRVILISGRPYKLPPGHCDHADSAHGPRPSRVESRSTGEVCPPRKEPQSRTKSETSARRW